MDPASVYPSPNGGFDFAPFHRIGDVGELDVEYRWRRKPYGDRLQVPIGMADNGSRVTLDLKSSPDASICCSPLPIYTVFTMLSMLFGTIGSV
ncbi:hypothetical protein C5E45_03355 [Nocardia nova]|uniref:Uncharacterized protein n=1 Tax=Nocardia nova TaxID=37330 RepID=A0A2S6AY27_9NOCA|nr:hypothetical protein [Nocardia nova]PPJ34068.1 hypothetical protein C5E41_00140 [Nocardia nova]PPJ40120.1 hypothetical protein C5E45_03355 [Nocardia nova]